MNMLKQILTAGSLALLLAACSDDNITVQPSGDDPELTGPADGRNQDIVQTAIEAGTFTVLTTALEVTGLDAVLADTDRQFTVFAPTDAAFAALGDNTITELLNDVESLSNILLYHVIADAEIDAQTAISLAGQSVSMANNQDTNLSLDGMRLFINDSEVVITDVVASNGIIHVIDKVLSPPAETPDAVEPEPQDPELTDLVNTALAAGNFTTLAAALEATDLISVLGDETRNFTVFAPTDEAFAALGKDTVDALLADPDALRDILLYHVLADNTVDAATAISLAGTTVETANGEDIALTLDEGNLFVNMSKVIATDVLASNGIIHVIDTVLIPPADSGEPALGSIVDTAAAAGSFNTLVAALQATGLDATLADPDSTYTVFAPTDEAFAKLGDDTIKTLLADPEALSAILLYHVLAGQVVDSTTAISLAGSQVATVNGESVAISVDGDRLLINQSAVVIPDIPASNGIIHAIDTVLLPPQPAPENAGTLLDIARADGNFTTLVAALELTGLDSAIGHPDDTYTVFAPTDAAFAKLGQATIDALLADPVKLANILRYHVLAGTVIDSQTAASLVGISIEAGNGERLVITQRDGALFVNDSKIIATDIRGVNGIIHVIDTVLIP
jgi:uncharacterized surface protein with fasciclin (FAS1) repeats